MGIKKAQTPINTYLIIAKTLIFDHKITKYYNNSPSAWPGNREPRANVFTQVKSFCKIWA